MKTLHRILLLCALSIGRGASAQCQTQKLVASDAEMEDYFGESLSASGDWLIVGAPQDDDLGIVSGAAYFFQKQGSTWVETQKIHAGDGSDSDQFAYAVGISGDIAVVTAFSDSPMGIFAAGSAYVFERSGATWNETAKLVAADASSEDHFGISVAVSGNRAVIGAAHDDPAGATSGSAYVFETTGGVWGQTAKLTPGDLATGDSFGFAVAIEGDTIAVSSLGDEGPSGQNNTGSAYVFEHTLGSWVETEKLIPNDSAANQGFGASVSVSGATVLVGAHADNTSGTLAGSVYAFDKLNGNWTQVQELTAVDSNPQNFFGAYLTHVGDVAIIGAIADSDSASVAGSAYVFRRSSSTWIQVGKMLAADGTQGDLLGRSVALVGDTAIAGANYEDSACPSVQECNSGAVYLFELAPTAVQYGSCKLVAACNNWDDHGGCRNSTTQGAVIAACGSGSVTTDDLRLEGTRCPPNKLTLLFTGPAQSQVVFGDGVRVAGAQNPVGVYRYGGAAADAQGRVLRGPGLVAYSQGLPALGRIQAGQVWNFQFWYRDPQGPCGTLTNFSNGVQVTFGP
ncbi:MAG: FG-GAP repeat protein [Planctomycetota bacterium]